MDTLDKEPLHRVFVCPECSKKLPFSKVMYVAKDTAITCNHCGASLTHGNANVGAVYGLMMAITVVVGFLIAIFLQPIVMPDSHFIGRVILYFPIMVGVYAVLSYLLFYRRVWFKVRR